MKKLQGEKTSRRQSVIADEVQWRKHPEEKHQGEKRPGEKLPGEKHLKE